MAIGGQVKFFEDFFKMGKAENQKKEEEHHQMFASDSAVGGSPRTILKSPLPVLSLSVIRPWNPQEQSEKRKSS